MQLPIRFGDRRRGEQAIPGQPSATRCAALLRRRSPSMPPSITAWATCMPCGPNSRARLWLSERRPAFAEAKAVNGGRPRSEAVAPVKNQAAHVRSGFRSIRRCSAAAAEPRGRTRIRRESRTRQACSNCSTVNSSDGARTAPAALKTAACRSPSPATSRLSASICASSAHVARQHVRDAAGRPHFGSDGLEPLARAAGQRDRQAALGVATRQCRPQPRTRADTCDPGERWPGFDSLLTHSRLLKRTASMLVVYASPYRPPGLPPGYRLAPPRRSTHQQRPSAHTLTPALSRKREREPITQS